jgi:hypothetical protein
MSHRVDLISEGTPKVMGVDRWWAPYATPDIDGDGSDEIAVATAYPGSDWSIHIWLYREDGTVVEPIPTPCGEGCGSYPWNTQLGAGSQENGSKNFSGLYCGSIKGAPKLGQGLVFWQVSEDEPQRMYATIYQVAANGIVNPRDVELSIAGRTEYPPTGETSLCGSRTRPLDVH